MTSSRTRFLADENFDGRLLRALQRRISDVDVLRVQDTHLAGADDPTVLEWAAAEGRVVLTHDLATFIGFACERLEAKLAMPGVIAVQTRGRSMGRVVEDLELLLTAAEPRDFGGQILFVPL